MRKLMWLAALLLAVACGALPLRAQDAKKAPPKPAPGMSDLVLEQWNDIGRKLIAMAEDFPEDKYNYKPAPESRTFAAMMLHVAGSMYYFTDIAEGKKPRYPDDPKDDNLKSKAQIVAFVKQCVSDGAEEIKKLGNKGLEKDVNDGGPASRSSLQSGLRAHRAFRGALRCAGGVLPEQWHGAAGIASEEVTLLLFGLFGGRAILAPYLSCRGSCNSLIQDSF